LIYLNNFCLLKNNKVDRKFLEESYDLYCFGLENELLLENGEMYPIDFKNIVIIGTGLKKYGWVHAFIQKHAVLLPPEIRENIVLICKAQLAKSKGNLGEVIDLLQDFEFNNVYDNLTSRSLLMRCYYELGEMHTLTFFIESFTKFVNRNKSLSGEVKLAVLNMIKFTKFLCNAKYQKESKEKLKTKLDNLSPIYAKKWLLKQIEEL